MTYYTGMLNTAPVNAALRKLKAVLDRYNAQNADGGTSQDKDSDQLSLPEVSLRWLMHHSALKGELGDAIVLGAKREDQLRGNVECCRKGPLPDVLVRAVGEMWEDVKEAMKGTGNW